MVVHLQNTPGEDDQSYINGDRTLHDWRGIGLVLDVLATYPAMMGPWRLGSVT